MKKFLKKLWYIISLKWWEEDTKRMVDSGALDYSGQGRDKYGK